AVYQIRTGPGESDRRFLFMSQSFERLSGVPAERVLADPMVAYDAVHPEDRQKLIDAELKAIETNSPFDVQARFRRADGKLLWCRFISAPRTQSDGTLIWDGILIDATARIEAENALRQINANLEQEVAQRTAERNQVWEMSRDLLAVMGFDGLLKAINPAWESTLGYDQATLLSMSFREQVHPDDHAAVVQAVERLMAGETIPVFEDRLRHKDGSWRWIAWSLVPSGEVFYATGRDVTAEKQAAAELQAAHEALRQSQKMEAMGQLTGGVAHDFNNLLTPIVGALDMLQRNRVGGDREQRLIAGAAQSADKAKTLVQRLLAFARRQPLQSTAVDLGELVAGMADLLASTTGPQIKVAVNVPTELPLAKADANQLEMALLNLSVNARDAMPEGGTIRITALAADPADAKRVGLPLGSYVRLSVADTGVGMDRQTLARAIEPFFSTKGVGKGTGLGLSMVHGLAAQLGGRLDITSTPGIGTNVELWLPVSLDALTARQVPADMADGAAPRGKALLVDDDDLVRASTADMLGDLGYSVVQANSAEQALTILTDGLDPDLLITDHLMPGLSGTELAREVRRTHPRTAVLLVSGYADVDGLAPDLPRLAKPFRQVELASSLAALKSVPDV
ncbi:MAG TPA: PAS domain-containing protein, partial [Sphingomicrobium sp.]